MRKNLNKQLGKRAWKTPSPSSNADIKSPRYNTSRAALLSVDPKTPKPDGQKSKPVLLTFKNQLVELKQEANRVAGVPSPTLDALVHKQYIDDGNEYKNNEGIDSYNSYFSRVSNVYSNLVKNSNNISKNNKFRGNGFKTEELESTAPYANYDSRYEEKLKKYVDQIAKLKENYKKLEDSYEKSCEYSKKVENQLEFSKSEVSVLKKKMEQKRYREFTLNEEINNLKELLEINTNELNSSNLQIYKMKQQIYELTIEKQKLQNRSHIQKVRASRSQIKLQTEQPCLMCKTNQKMIVSLNNAIQNKMLEIGKKDSTIQSLCADLQKLQIQSKMYEKPKFVVRKVTTTLEAVNQLLITNKIKELNNKFRREATNSKEDFY